MKDRRVDRIERLLDQRKGRARIKELLKDLRKEDANPSLPSQSIYIAIQQENERLEALGESTRFVTSREGEDRGWVRLRQSTKIASGSEAEEIESSIKQRNERLDQHIKQWLQAMDWRTFESTFLSKVLAAFGYREVEITQPTRDGGVDARAKYRLGLAEARAVISVKHWKDRTVSVKDVRELQGITSEGETAIFVTTGEFSKDAETEAKQRKIVCLINGRMLIDICKQHKIGVKLAKLPELMVLDPEVTYDSSPSNGLEESDSSKGSEDVIESNGIRRLRDEMLGDSDKDLSPREIAELTGYSLNTVRAYLSDRHRRKTLGDSIREDEKTRSRALKIICLKRNKHRSK